MRSFPIHGTAEEWQSIHDELERSWVGPQVRELLKAIRKGIDELRKQESFGDRPFNQ